MRGFKFPNKINITDHLGNLGIAKITQANAYGVWGEDLPTLSLQVRKAYKELATQILEQDGMIICQQLYLTLLSYSFNSSTCRIFL